jgi:tetratricopeptide (TPR) repeat protein
MGSDQEDRPGKAEIFRQLTRISESTAFHNTTSQSKLLIFIINSFLEKTDISANDLNSALFPKGHADPETAVGRVTARNVRKTLKEYYKTEGHDDLVVIEILRGKAYTPKIVYNPRSRACAVYRKGMAQLRMLLSHESADCALVYLNRATERDPLYSAAYSGKAQIEFIMAMYRHDSAPSSWVSRAEKSALQALDLNPVAWRAHLVLAAVYCSRLQWKEAKDSFTKALSIDAFETERHFLYISYLAAIGEFERADILACSALAASPEDPFTELVAATVCYLKRGNWFIEAIRIASSVTREHSGLAFAYGLKACATNALGRSAGGLMITSSKGYLEECHRRLGVEAFPGLEILALGSEMMVITDHDRRRTAMGVIQDKMAEIEIQAREGYVPHFQLALAHIGVEEWEEATKHLALAVSENDPKMIWINLWPFFDPMREYAAFKDLVASMNIPR